MKRTLYHITAPENVDTVIKKGLIAQEYDDNGSKGVFLFENETYLTLSILCNADGSPNMRYKPIWRVADKIAMTEVGLMRYSLFEVKVDSGKLIKDDVAEETAEWQYIYHGDISPEAIKLQGTYDALSADKYQVFDLENKCLCSKEVSKHLWEEHIKAFESIREH